MHQAIQPLKEHAPTKPHHSLMRTKRLFEAAPRNLHRTYFVEAGWFPTDHKNDGNMKKISASLAAWTAVAILVTATGCASVSNLHSSSSVNNQDNTIIVMGNGISYLED